MEKILNASNVYKVSWENRKLQVYFYDDTIVEYIDVPEGVYRGLITSDSPGSYIHHYMTEFDRKKIQDNCIESELKKLKHHKDTTVGLWATDKPEQIPEEIKHLFFEITETK